MSEINIDSEALKSRITAHDKLAEKDVNDWIFEISKPELAGNTLDIGCGTGKQTLPLSEKIREGGKVVGVDLSEESLQFIRDSSSRDNIITVRADIDSFFDKLPITGYDLIQSCFAIYYSKKQAALLNKLFDILNTSGSVFICGYNFNNNGELLKLHNSLLSDSSLIDPKPAFISDSDIDKAFSRYSSIQKFEFTNRIFYDSPKSVLSYWKNYYLYNKEIEKKFEMALNSLFNSSSKFTVTKRVLGILAKK